MKKILIVEDVEFNVDLLMQLLEDDYQLCVAGNGAEGVERARTERPDLILMDMSLPLMDGWEATARIKSNPELAGIPIIALTAHAMHGDEDRALGSGCDDYLTKPLDEDLLYAKIEHHLAQAEATP